MKKLSLILLSLNSVLFAFGNKQGEANKPNILWVTIEDTSPQFIGCYGNETSCTPVIDKLASEGVRFTNAFSTGTVCSPSRTAIITGVKTYKTGTGNHRSKYPVPDYIKGFPYYMQQQGYYTTNNAKTDYNVAEEKTFIEEAWDESSTKAGWWNRKTGQPFFAVFNFNESHQSRTMTESYDWYLENVLYQLSPEERIKEDAFDMPPFYRDSPEMRKQFARVYNSIKLTDSRIGRLLEKLDADNLKDSTIIFFFADHGEGMPRGKTNGINYGYRVPFIIWFPEMYKHLSPWGTKGAVTSELIDFTDLAPTLLSLAGGNIPTHLEGRPYLGERRQQPVDYLYLSSDRSDNGIDMVRTVTDGKYIYSRNYLPFIYEARYIRYMEIGDIKKQMRKDLAENQLNELQKSLFEPRPAEYLFDVENDIWETCNLVEEQDFQHVKDKMRSLLKEEVLKSHDIMFLPEYEIGLLSDSTSAYEFRLNENAYPLDKIFEAASTSGHRGKEITAKQIMLLKDQNPQIRYWAIYGLRSQDEDMLKHYRSEIASAMKDDYLPVSVIASSVAYNFFNDPQAKENLKKYCADENLDIALLAIYSLLYVKDKTPFIETIKQVREMEGRNYNVKACCMDFLGSFGLVPNTMEFRQ